MSRAEDWNPHPHRQAMVRRAVTIGDRQSLSQPDSTLEISEQWNFFGSVGLVPSEPQYAELPPNSAADSLKTLDRYPFVALFHSCTLFPSIFRCCLPKSLLEKILARKLAKPGGGYAAYPFPRGYGQKTELNL